MNEASEYAYLGETIDVPITGSDPLQATVAYCDETDVDRMLLVFPPNPILGGDSRNNVVQALLAEAVKRQALAVTFDYRGSNGSRVGDVDMMTYWEALNAGGDFSQIIEDAVAVVSAIKTAFGSPGCCALAGYSFGCYMALQSAPQLGRPPVGGISPPLEEYDFRPWLKEGDLHLFVAPDDPFCPTHKAKELCDNTGMAIHTVASDDHFFRGTEPLLARTVCDTLQL